MSEKIAKEFYNLKKKFDNGKVYSYENEKKEILIKGIANSRKQTADAFLDIFSNLSISNFIVEHPYMDKDYLEDYSNYYARCYTNYDRFCLRIHFFKSEKNFHLNDDLFRENLIQRNENFENELNSNYQGFMVLRPLGKTIGKTCLKSYKNDISRNRKYYAKRKYKVHLYGIKLEVDSLAFQEQDEAVAVCASVALWSAFHLTGIKNQHKIPSPSIVTKLALSESSYIKHFPSTGLSAEQIAVAINKVGVTPVIIRPASNRLAKAFIYAYLKADIPIVCGISLFDVNNRTKEVVKDSSFHAVTINGFSFEDSFTEVQVKKQGISLYSSKMTKFFAHDDQMCPFSRMEFQDHIYFKDKSKLIQPIKTTWEKTEVSDECYNHKFAKIESFIIPLNEKIRITFDEVFNKTKKINNDITKLIHILNKKAEEKGKSKIVLKNYEWDIYLTTINEFKDNIRNNKTLSKEEKQNLLFKDYPKYLWISRIVKQENIDSDLIVLIEIIFDATESKISYIKEVISFKGSFRAISQSGILKEKNYG